MSKRVEIKAIGERAIRINLPDGFTVKPKEEVPVEVLEMLVAYARLQQNAPEVAGQSLEPAYTWCWGGCGAQVK